MCLCFKSLETVPRSSSSRSVLLINVSLSEFCSVAFPKPVIGKRNEMTLIGLRLIQINIPWRGGRAFPLHDSWATGRWGGCCWVGASSFWDPIPGSRPCWVPWPLTCAFKVRVLLGVPILMWPVLLGCLGWKNGRWLLKEPDLQSDPRYWLHKPGQRGISALEPAALGSNATPPWTSYEIT